MRSGIADSADKADSLSEQVGGWIESNNLAAAGNPEEAADRMADYMN